MAAPNSMLTRLRERLSCWLNPSPDMGEAWCIDCALNGGRTYLMSASAQWDHVEAHRNSPERHLKVKSSLPWTGNEEGELVTVWGYLKACMEARALSWVTGSEKSAVVTTMSGTQVVLSTFRNGRRADYGSAQSLPNTVPEEWNNND